MSDPLTDASLAIDPQQATPPGDDVLLSDIRRDAAELRSLGGTLATREDAQAMRWISGRMASRAEALAARYTRALRAIQEITRRLTDTERRAGIKDNTVGGA